LLANIRTSLALNFIIYDFMNRLERRDLFEQRAWYLQAAILRMYL